MERDEPRHAQGRPLPAALPGRPVLPRRPLARARRDARLPALAHPRQGRLRDQGRARLPAPRRLRPARVREPDRLAVRRPDRHRRDLDRRGRIAWQVERHFGRYGEMRASRGRRRSRCSSPTYANAAPADLLGARLRRARAGPRPAASSSTSCASASSCWSSATAASPELAAASRRAPRRRTGRGGRAEPSRQRPPPGGGDPARALRPAGHAGQHPDRGRARGPPPRSSAERVRAAADLRAGAARGHLGAQRRQLRRRRLRALRRGRAPTARSRSTPSPTRTRSHRPARLLPVEAKALVAAIDLIGEHIPEGSLSSAREKIVAALGEDPVERGPADRRARRRRRRASRAVVSRAIAERRLLEIEYYKENEDEFSDADGRAVRADQRPRGLVRGDLRSRRATTCATSGWTGSRRRRSLDEPSSRGPRSTRSPTSTAGRAPARSPARAARACGSRPSGRAGRARSAPSSPSSPTAR